MSKIVTQNAAPSALIINYFATHLHSRSANKQKDLIIAPATATKHHAAELINNIIIKKLDYRISYQFI